MTYSLIWLPTVLQSAGLKIALVDGWENRGHGDVGKIQGVICHHTAGGKSGNMPSLNVIVKGRSDLAGPLSQLGLGRDGTYYIIAAGKAYHAGPGAWNGIKSGNTSFIGIEAENTGRSDDPWPKIQMDAYKYGVAAILKHLGLGATACCGHGEYALPAGRKNDPSFNMKDFRNEVATYLGGATSPIALIPHAEAGPDGRPTLRRGARGDQVSNLQQRLIDYFRNRTDGNLSADGVFGALTETAVRAFQREKNLTPDGIVGPKTWAAFATN